MSNYSQANRLVLRPPVESGQYTSAEFSRYCTRVDVRPRSSMINNTAIPALVKWVVSKIQMLFGVYLTQSGNGRRWDLPGRGSGRKCLSARESTRRTVEGETHTRLR